MLRRRGVVGRFVEYCGPGIAELALADRATIGNMAPEYGATCGFFPIDAETIRYLTLTARDPARVKLVEAYAKAQGLWRDADTPDPVFTDLLELDLGSVEPSLAGPRRPQDRVALSAASPPSFDSELPRLAGASTSRARSRSRATNYDLARRRRRDRRDHQLHQHLEPERHAGRRPAWPRRRSRRASRSSRGSRPASRRAARWSATTTRRPACRNISTRSASTWSAMAAPPASAIRGRCPSRSPRRSTTAISRSARCLSGNRNFEGRIHAQVRANYLASPPLVVAYALAGSIRHNLVTEPLGEGGDGKPVYLRDIWPSNQEVADTVAQRGEARGFRAALRQRASRDRRNGAQVPSSRRPDLRFRGPLDLSRAAALFREHAEGAGADTGRDRRARAGDLRRQHHHRPHLAGRQHQGRQPGRRIPDQLSGAPGRSSTPTARAAATTT